MKILCWQPTGSNRGSFHFYLPFMGSATRLRKN